METKKCPYCGKTILAMAKTCKHCRQSLVSQEESSLPQEESSLSQPLEQETVSEPPPSPAFISPPPPQYQSPNPYPPIEKPDNLLAWSILTTVFCCIPAGIVAIVYSNKVNTLWEAKDYMGAKQASDKARTWCYVSVTLGIVGGIITFISGIL